jgi:hypothetical protein
MAVAEVSGPERGAARAEIAILSETFTTSLNGRKKLALCQRIRLWHEICVISLREG